jgi:hypothetical protein
MIIDRNLNYVFVAVPKTASTTIHKMLGYLKDSSHEFLQHKYHYPIYKIIEENQGIDNFWKFGFTRNPWDRFYSSWLEFTTREDHLNTWSRDLTLEFSNFEEFCLNFSTSKWAHEIHFQPSTFYLYFNNKQIDFIGRYENLKDDLSKIFFHVNGKPLNDKKIPITRKTNRSTDYRLYYKNNQMINAIGDFYNSDLTNFNYEF